MTTDQNRYRVVTEVAVVLGVEVSALTDTTDLREEYDVDSLEIMEIATRIEKAVGVRLDAKDLISMRVIGDLVAAVDRRLAT